MPSIHKSASARILAHQSPHSTSRLHSRTQDPGHKTQGPDFLPHTPQTYFLGLASFFSTSVSPQVATPPVWAPFDPRLQGGVRAEQGQVSEGVHMPTHCFSHIFHHVVIGTGQGLWLGTSSTKTTTFQHGPPRIWENSILKPSLPGHYKHIVAKVGRPKILFFKDSLTQFNFLKLFGYKDTDFHLD